ncbi:MAG: hypothetical protein DHS20C18_43330 [Saprospiraceae bacterium]|nr:MAG: hypothetical protein DHS20C18_43330 [Saprospiraceae bacterium]
MPFFLFVALLIGACQQDTGPQWTQLDLMSYGIPLNIAAPDSAKVKTTDLGLMKDITIQEGKDYYVQLYASSASTNDIAKIKADQLSEVKSNRFFSKIVKEETDGFIYETSIDSSNINYGFRYIYLQGDMEYIFQTGLIGTFTQEQTERMYEAVKQK